MPETQGVTNVIIQGMGFTIDAPTPNPIAVTDTGSVAIVAANGDRKYVMLQNNSTAAVLIRLSAAAASSTAYNFILGAASVLRNGTGGTATITNYVGAINARTTAGIAEIGTVEVI